MKRKKTTPIPLNIELQLIIIREELIMNKFFNTLAKLGMVSAYYAPGLSQVILTAVGFKTISDELMIFYLSLLDKYSAQAEPRSFEKYAVRMYSELEKERKRRAQRKTQRMLTKEVESADN